MNMDTSITAAQVVRLAHSGTNREKVVSTKQKGSTGVSTEPSMTSNQCEQVLRTLSQPQSQRNEHSLSNIVPWLKSRSEIFSKCDRAVVLDILQNCTVEYYEPNNVIIKAGEKGDCFYIILDGLVTVWINGVDDAPVYTTDSGRRATQQCVGFGTKVSKLGVGKGFGEVALISKDSTRTASIICEETAQLLSINRVLYNRSIKSWQARELYEKYHFLHNSVFFRHLPAKQKNQVSHSLKKQTIKFGNFMMKQSELISDIYFIISGQVRITCQPFKLQKMLLKHKAHILTSEEKSDIRECINSEDNTLTASRDICLLSSYDVIGSTEAALDLPVSAHTVAVEEEVVCFTLSRSSYKTLIKERSYKTVAGFLSLAIMQTEGRCLRYPSEYSDFSPLLTVLTRCFKELCKNDVQVMRSIEVALFSNATQGSGYGHTLYAADIPTSGKAVYQLPKLKLKTRDAFTSEGVDFLSSLSSNGFANPSLAEAKMLSPQRYAMTASINSPNKSIRGYIQALLNSDDSTTRVSAWRYDLDGSTCAESEFSQSSSTQSINYMRNTTQQTKYKSIAPLPANLSVIGPKPAPKLASLLPGHTIDCDVLDLSVHGAPLSITDVHI